MTSTRRTRGVRVLAALFFLVCSASPLYSQEAAERGPEVWAVVIGINDYEVLPDCIGAALDSREVARYLERTGWGEDHVLRLDDYGYPAPDKPAERTKHLKPTLANLQWALEVWLVDRLKPRDLAVIYFAGHAVSLATEPGVAQGTRPRDYLLPSDARENNLEGTGWQLEKSLDTLGLKAPNAVICWLDTSVQGRGRRVVRGQELEPTAKRLLTSMTRWPNVTVWLAADGQVASEGPAPGDRSPFADGLLRALGSADRPNSLLGALHAMRLDKAVNDQGFRAEGGIAPGLSLWPGRTARATLPARELVVQRGHADRIRGVVVTADGFEIATASMDSTLRIWRAADRSLYRVLGEHQQGIQSLALSPDGRWIVTGDGSGRIRVWDRIDQQSRAAVGAGGKPPHAGSVDFVGFLPDSRGFVSLDSRLGTLLLWDATERKLEPKRTLVDAGAAFAACASSPWLAARDAPPAVAVAVADGRVRQFRADGIEIKAQEGIGESCTALDMSPDGRTLVIGGDQGTAAVREAATGRELLRRQFNGKIDALRLFGSSLMAVGAAASVSLIAIDKSHAGAAGVIERPVPGGVGSLTFSGDGRYLAACTATVGGALNLWRVGSGAGRLPDLTPMTLRPTAEELGGATSVSLSFSPDGQMIVAGDDQGGLQCWSLPDGELRFEVPPNRRKVAALSVSGKGEHLLQITTDGSALVWDLVNGRGLRALNGQFTAGAFLDDPGTLVMTTDANQGGDIVRVDVAPGPALPLRFERPEATGASQRVATVFDKLAVARKAKRVAAGSSRNYKPMAGVWDAESGKLIHVIPFDKSLVLTCLALSSDGMQLLTGLDRSAKLWELSEGPPKTTLVQSIPMGATIECAAFGPTPAASRLIALGTQMGQVLLWRGGDDQPEPLPGAPFAGPVCAVAFSTDGRWLTAAGADKRIAVWVLGGQPQSIDLTPNPHHDERINALVAWPEAPMIVSGSDDATIRFWSLAEHRLLGTFSAFRAPSRPGKAPGGRSRDPADWVVFTPEGMFDSSADGGELVRWSFEGEVRRLEQSERAEFQLYRPQLVEELRQGLSPVAPRLPEASPPSLALESASRRDDLDRNAVLTIVLRETDMEDVRLYQEGVPVQSSMEKDFKQAADPRRLVANVRLRSGENHFYAMASRPGAIDGRSREVVLRYTGPDRPGQLHVLALGVSKYQRRTLRFADRDAREIAEFFRLRGIEASGEEGLCLVLTNEEVTHANVQKALLKLRDRVKDRPQDTVVVFLAGHTGVSAERFSMLLPTYRFPATDPLAVTTRAAEVEPTAETVLPFADVYKRLARLNALQRFVIIDACQAEAIYNDPKIGKIQMLMATDSRPLKTTYLLAAREVEPAGEVTALQHGLFTYTLLRGMGASLPGLRPEDENLPVFRTLRSADLDGDAWITLAELRRYAEQTLPALVGHYLPAHPPGNVRRRTPELHAADASFPLVPVIPARDGTR